ncbi:MAG: hypothetical protein ACK4K7_15465 [Allosphingosinicella sp.]|uniref:hypothetical protein n=1 Tax=Allosphingosinicella sp. TaxID=2823234 RepID=UPI00393DA67E
MARTLSEHLEGRGARRAGLVLLGVAAGLGATGLLKAGRKGFASLRTVTHRSGTPDPSYRPAADPAAGRAA